MSFLGTFRTLKIRPKWGNQNMFSLVTKNITRAVATPTSKLGNGGGRAMKKVSRQKWDLNCLNLHEIQKALETITIIIWEGWNRIFLKSFPEAWWPSLLDQTSIVNTTQTLPVMDIAKWWNCVATQRTGMPEWNLHSVTSKGVCYGSWIFSVKNLGQLWSNSEHKPFKNVARVNHFFFFFEK